jgi:ADP-ribose diphosphatase
VGYAARELVPLRCMTVAPGYIAHQIHVILARDLYPDRLDGDEPEALEIVPWPLSRLAELLTREDLTEARSIAALYLARDHLQGTDR